MTNKIVKETIVARSPKGNAVFTWDNESNARRWREDHQDHRLSFFKQVTTEEEITL